MQNFPVISICKQVLKSVKSYHDILTKRDCIHKWFSTDWLMPWLLRQVYTFVYNITQVDCGWHNSFLLQDCLWSPAYFDDDSNQRTVKGEIKVSWARSHFPSKSVSWFPCFGVTRRHCWPADSDNFSIMYEYTEVMLKNDRWRVLLSVKKLTLVNFWGV